MRASTVEGKVKHVIYLFWVKNGGKFGSLEGTSLGRYWYGQEPTGSFTANKGVNFERNCGAGSVESITGFVFLYGYIEI